MYSKERLRVGLASSFRLISHLIISPYRRPKARLLRASLWVWTAPNDFLHSPHVFFRDDLTHDRSVVWSLCTYICISKRGIMQHVARVYYSPDVYFVICSLSSCFPAVLKEENFPAFIIAQTAPLKRYNKFFGCYASRVMFFNDVWPGTKACLMCSVYMEIGAKHI